MAEMLEVVGVLDVLSEVRYELSSPIGFDMFMKVRRAFQAIDPRRAQNGSLMEKDDKATQTLTFQGDYINLILHYGPAPYIKLISKEDNMPMGKWLEIMRYLPSP